MDDLETLKSYANDLRTVDKFMDLHSRLLNSAWIAKDVECIVELQKILLTQCEFIFNEYLKMESKVSIYEGEILQ